MFKCYGTLNFKKAPHLIHNKNPNEMSIKSEYNLLWLLSRQAFLAANGMNGLKLNTKHKWVDKKTSKQIQDYKKR